MLDPDHMYGLFTQIIQFDITKCTNIHSLFNSRKGLDKARSSMISFFPKIVSIYRAIFAYY